MSGPRPAEERANRFIFIVLALQRASYLLPTLVSATSGVYKSSALNAALLGVTILWNIALFADAVRRRWFAPWMTLADVAWASVLIAAVAANLPTDQPHNHADWSGRIGQAAAALAGVGLASLFLGAAAVAAMLAVQAVTLAVLFSGVEGLGSEIFARLNSILWFALILGFALRYLRRQGRLLDEAAADRALTEAGRAADKARYDTRIAHHRALHDTVLSTLTAIARGGLDHREGQVRSRCARDADYVRRLLDGDPTDDADTLDGKLSEAVAAAEAVGLRVSYRRDPVPDDVPVEVVTALGDAAREALNNVAKHAGTGRAWLTAGWEAEQLSIRVVDRGRGFDTEATEPGFGLRESVHERVRAVGGNVRVISGPDEGTCVELAWHR